MSLYDSLSCNQLTDVPFYVVICFLTCVHIYLPAGLLTYLLPHPPVLYVYMCTNRLSLSPSLPLPLSLAAVHEFLSLSVALCLPPSLPPSLPHSLAPSIPLPQLPLSLSISLSLSLSLHLSLSLSLSLSLCLLPQGIEDGLSPPAFCPPMCYGALRRGAKSVYHRGSLSLSRSRSLSPSLSRSLH